MPHQTTTDSDSDNQSNSEYDPTTLRLHERDGETECFKSDFLREHTQEKQIQSGTDNVKNKPTPENKHWVISDLCSASNLSIIFGILTAVSSILLVNYSLNSSIGDPIDADLKKFDYPTHDGDSHGIQKRQGYGASDLMSATSRQELVHRLSKSAAEKGVKASHGLKNKPAGVKEFMTIELHGRRKRKDGEEQYMVVFDAGSTGTRVHVYFFKFEDGDSDPVLEAEVYRKVKPGLSDFVNNPDDGVASIQPLVDYAMELVPKDLHSSTPLIFKATAGLRLLDADGAENLLNKVREHLGTTDFKFEKEEVDIMGGTEEGVFGWITINYLLGNLDGEKQTVATLDLGGGSIQVTFEETSDVINTNSMDYLIWIDLFGTGYTLYSSSYLGLGLKAARNSTLTPPSESGMRMSNCLPVNYSASYSYSGETYHVRGPSKPAKDECWYQVGAFLASSRIAPMWDFLEDPDKPKIYLFSYFYDMLQWAGIIDKETEYTANVDSYYNAATAICDSPPADDPFLCEDLTYVTRMLGEGFRLWDKPLHVVSQINSGETSWTLGAALQALSTMQMEE